MKLKLCGMRRQQDLIWAAEAGFDCCGFIFHSKSPRNVEPELARSLHSDHMLRIGVFVEQEAEEIIAIMAEAKLDLAQLHGSQSRETAQRIGANSVIRVLWPGRYSHMAELEKAAAQYADSCAWYLLDAGASGGGSGRRIDATGLAQIHLPHPWFLAGGLEPSILTNILAVCSPDGLDFNSGLEIEPGIKDRTKIFEVREKLARIGGSR